MQRRAWRHRLTALAGVGALVGVLTCSAPASAAPPENAGPAVVVVGAGSTRPLAKGGSATEFSLRIPEGSTCPGDSANDNFRVQSYFVPATVAPEAIVWDGLGPTPWAYGEGAIFRQPLFDTSTRPYASAQTADATAPGQPGAIIDIPAFSFGIYAPGDLPPGEYHIGIACTVLNQLVKYWNVKVVLSRAPDDEPAQINWRVADGSADASADGPTTTSSGLTGPAVVGGVVVVVLGAAAYARRRFRPRTSIESTEER